ncbi:MAG TPA: hypothetical protein GXX29_05000 [Firmicutes bacterium]|nr:hypothetical protein [Bacillota bacterium]
MSEKLAIPAVIAHRGACDTAPENTLPAFREAMTIGSDGIETDVQMTKDGHLVLIHDARVDRTTNGEGLVSNFTLRELRALDAGSWFSKNFTGTTIPLLSELLDLCAGQIPLVIEIKAKGIEQLLKENILHHPRGREANITFTSFSLDYLVALKGIWPEAHCGYLVREPSFNLVPGLRASGIRQICPPAKSLTSEAVEAWHKEGFTVRAWDVKTEDMVRHCAAIGVDGFTVNFPKKALIFLGKQVNR